MLPENIKSETNAFEQWYKKNHDSRKLAWQAGLGVITLAFKGAKMNHEVDVSPYQALVLLLFSDEEVTQMTYKQITEKLCQKEVSEKNVDPNKVMPGIPAIELKQAVFSLIFAKPKSRILMRDAKQKDQKTNINDETIVMFNKKFDGDKFKIIMGSSEVNVIDKKEEARINKQIQEDRSFRLDAILVRIMKAKKQLNHNELMVEVKNEVGGSFEVVPGLVKKRIENLINREFLKRIESDIDGQAGYEYLA